MTLRGGPAATSFLLTAIPLAFAVAAVVLAQRGGVPLFVPRLIEANGAIFVVVVDAVAVAAFVYRFVALGARPVAPGAVVACALATLAAALATPAIFSADPRAYAAYGELALRGELVPRALAAPAAALGPCIAAALHDWHGTLPANVYGPLFTAVAAAIVALAGHRPDAARWGFRLVACAAWIAVVVTAGRRRPADAALYGAHPVALWTVAEGHNDALFLAPLLIALALHGPRARIALLTAASALKAVAAFALLRELALRPRYALPALGALLLAYAPLAWTASAPRLAGAGPPRISPFAALAHAPHDPAWPVALAVAVAALALAPAAWRRDPAGAAALLGWTFAPVAYPWYATWLLPLSARDPRTPTNRALLAASLVAFLGYAQDATSGGGPALSVGVMMVQYAVPLVVLALALAQSSPAPRPAPEATPAPTARATPKPVATPTLPPEGVPLPTPTPTGTAVPSGTPLPRPTPAASGTAQPGPAVSPSPYAFVVEPTPVPNAPANAPRILQIAVNDQVIHAGGALVARITTTPDVTGVTARVMGQQLGLSATSPGVYLLDQRVPSGVPFWLFKSYDVEIVAARADGATASAHVTLRLAR